MRVYEEYMMFKAGVETMFPPGSLIFFKHLMTNEGSFKKSVPLYKENPHFCKTDKEKESLKYSELIRNEPFTIMEIDIELIPGGSGSSYSLFFEYKIYFHIIQFDKIGWVSYHVDATRYDEALKVLSNRIVFAEDVNDD